MKTKWRLFIVWSVLSLTVLISFTADTYVSPSAHKRKKHLRLGTSRSRPDADKLSAISERRSSRKIPVGAQIYPPPPASPPGIQSSFAYLPDVSVTCSTSDFVIRVKPSFYGFGAEAAELKLGSGCSSTGVLRPYGDLLFTYPLTACDSRREWIHGYLVYKFTLHYEPSPKRFPSNAHRLHVGIECHYQRNHHVYQLAVKPTWQTAVVRKRLKGKPNDFQIELMDDSWSRPTESQVFQLGETIHFQVSVPQLPSGGKLYISSCYAAPSSGSASSLKYSIIDNFGCMLDGKRHPGASRFISRTDKTLRFSLKAFQFISDPDTEISIHCKLFVLSEEPGPAYKSCSFRGDRWKALAGDDSICDCCDSQCVTSKTRRAMMEGSASSGVLVSDQPHTSEDELLPLSPSFVSMQREDTTTRKPHTDEINSREILWENSEVLKYDGEGYVEEDEEEEQLEDAEDGRGMVNFGEITEPELLENFVFSKSSAERKESEERDSLELREDGSGYEEEGFEGRDEEKLVPPNQKEGEVLRNWTQLEQLLSQVSLQREMQPLDPEGEEEDRKYVHMSEDTAGTEASELKRRTDGGQADDRELTWYFTWR